MATSSMSIAEELLGNIPMLNAFQLRALVPYLSPEDATTIDDFEQSELAEDYYVETINLRYGKLENKNHLFDVFSKYCGYDDSTYTRLDMLTFLAENTTRYEWNAHVLLKMHGTNLDSWVKTMTDCLNRGDELAIYALCDMLKRHAFVFTWTKPWTTVDGSIGSLTVPELCMMCDVRLIYLGNNKFGEIKCKPEVLSPLPKPKPFKEEQTSHTLVSPSEELVVGILDESKSSCTLVSLPLSPETAKIELAKQDIGLKLEEESNNRTLPVEMPCVNTANNSRLIPQIAPTSSPTDTMSKMALPNRDQAIVSAPPPVVNETKPELTDGTQLSTKQPESKKPMFPTDKNQYDKTNGNKESKAETSTLEIKETDIDKTGQDQIKELGNSKLISETIEQLNLTRNIANKESEQEKLDSQYKTGTNHTTNIRMCTVRLEILTEADIVKHVHIHKEIKSKTAPPAKPSELVGTVETVEMTHFTRSRTKTKLPRTNRLPRTASSNIAYVHQDEQRDSGSSPSAKRKRNSRPRMEPSSSRIKADSFSTKSPSV